MTSQLLSLEFLTETCNLVVCYEEKANFSIKVIILPRPDWLYVINLGHNLIFSRTSIFLATPPLQFVYLISYLFVANSRKGQVIIQPFCVICNYIVFKTIFSI